jgi:hypothetical protein
VPRPRWHLEIRITRPLPSELEGFDTSRFEVGRVYDVNAPLCDLLVTSGYAVEHVPPAPATTPDAAPDKRANANDQLPPKQRP